MPSMAENPPLERELTHDLTVLGDMVADESFYPELYRGLAGVRWPRRRAHHVELEAGRGGRQRAPRPARPRPARAGADRRRGRGLRPRRRGARGDGLDGA